MSQVVLVGVLSLIVFFGISWLLVFLIDRLTSAPGPGGASWLRKKSIRWIVITILAVALWMGAIYLFLVNMRM